MTAQEIKARALDAESRGTVVTLNIPVPYPKGFPRGELLCDNGRGGRIYMLDPLKLLAWCRRIRPAV